MRKAKRLAMLEQAVAKAREERIEAQRALAMRVFNALPRETCAALRERWDMFESDPEEERRILNTALDLICPLEHPAREAVIAWMEATALTPEDGVQPLAPIGTVEYLEAEIADWQCAQQAEASWTDEMRTAARWSAASLRYYAQHAHAVGERSDGMELHVASG